MRAAPSPKSANDLNKETVSWKADPAETGYGGAVDVVRAADLYAQGRTQGHVTCKGGKELRLSSPAVCLTWPRFLPILML